MSHPSLRLLIAAALLVGLGLAVRSMMSEPSPPDPAFEASPPEVEPDTPEQRPPEVEREPPDHKPTRVQATPVASGRPVEASDGNASLAGRVISEEGPPVEGARVRLYRGTATMPGLNFPGSRRDTGLEVETDDEGLFLFDGIAGFQNYILVASHPDFADAEYTGVAVAEGDSLYLPREIVLKEGARIFGTVRSPSGPVAGAEVELWDTMAASFMKPGEKRPWATTETDADGKYEFRHVSFPGSKVVVRKDGYATVSKMNTVLFAKVESRQIDFDLEPAAVLTGVTVDPSGRPIENAVVQAYQIGQPQEQGASEGRAVSDSGGVFRVSGLAKGTYNLSVSARGFSDKQVTSVASDATDVRVVLEPRGSVTGRVLVAATGQPATRFSLRVKARRGDSEPFPTARREAFQTNDGGFVLDDLDPGTYVLEAEAKGYAPTDSEPFTIDRGQMAGPVEIRLTQGATVKGVVVDSSGAPVAGATVTLRQNKHVANPIAELFRNMPNSVQLREPSTRTLGDGSFRIDLVVPGVRQVEVRHPRYPDLAVNDVQLRDGEETDVGRLVLSAGGRIRGQAQDEAGRPFVNGEVTCSGGTISSRQVRPDINGYFEFDNLAPGEYQVSLRPESAPGQGDMNAILQVLYAQQTTQKVTVQDGQVTEVNLRLKPPRTNN